jgi:hypothetical protein
MLEMFEYLFELLIKLVVVNYRLGYPVHILRSISGKLPEELSIAVIYDISCVLHRNMQVLS